MRTIYKSFVHLLLAVVLIFSTQAVSYAQCAGNTTSGSFCTRSNFYYGEILPDSGCETWTEVTPYSPGEYFRTAVLPGACYSISTCGAGIDTQIGCFQGTLTSGPFAYDDDNGPLCTGTAASVTMVPTFNDYVRVDVRQYNCQPGGSASITVRLRQNNNLSITSSNTDFCQGQSRTLTATPTAVTPFTSAAGDGGTFSGTGVSGTIFTAPVPPGASGTYNVTYTYGYCSTSQSLTVYRLPSTSNAGPDQMVNVSTATMAGNTPTAGTGTWTLVAGSGTITSPNDPASGVTGLGLGVNTFRWTVANGPCAVSTDDVDITFSDPLPELDVRNNADDADITDGSITISTALGTDFGSVCPMSGSSSSTFRAENNGGGILTFGADALSISNTTDFSITSDLANNGTVAVGGVETFTITFDPASVGTKTCTVTISSDDPDEDPYTFEIQGVGYAIMVSNPAAATATQLHPYSSAFVASGGVPPYSFSTSSNLPAGIKLATTGLLHGMPTVTGVFAINVDATDANGCTASSSFNLTIGAGAIGVARWVNNSGGTRPAQVTFNCIDYATAATTYTTIQSAINAAGSGDIVYITDGTYANPAINTNCIIGGASASNQIDITSKTNLIITSSTGSYCNSNAIITGYGFEIAYGDNITIQGLKLENVPANAFYNSNAGTQTNNVTIKNNWVLNTFGHGIKTDDHPSDGVIDRSIWEISGNKFENIGAYNPGPCSLGPVSAIWLAQAGFNFNIFNNIITNTRWAGILCVGQGHDNSVASTEIATISGNRIDQTVDAGIQIGFSAGAFYYSNGATITHNTITNANTSNKVGIGGITILQNNIYGVSITYNDVSSSFNGIAIEIAGWENSPDTKIIKYNNFYNLSVGSFGATHIAGIAPNGLFGTGDDLFLYDFKNNYWGDGSGPTHSANPAGTGEALKKDVNALGAGTYSLNDYVYMPFLTAPTTVNSVVDCANAVTVSFTAPADLCVDAGVQTGLGGGTPTGGVYSGTGVTDNGNGMTYSFDPAGAGVGTHTLTYSYSDGNGCTSTTDDVEVFALPTTANAGPDQVVPSVTTTMLAGNTPTTGTGMWSIVTGMGGSFGNASSPNSSFSGTVNVVYTLRWTISNGPCTVSSDDVQITFTNPELDIRNAADNMDITDGSTTISSALGTDFGNVCVSSGSSTNSFRAENNGTSVLTFDADALTLSNTTDFSVSSDLPNGGAIAASGVETFTIAFDPASSGIKTCTVTIFSDDADEDPYTFLIQGVGQDDPTPANAGPDQNVCATTATLAGNTPTVGTGSWSLVSGSGTVTTPGSPTSGVTGLGVGANVFRWTIDAGNSCPNSTDDVTITRDTPPTVANAGADQNVCATTATLAGNTPTVGTGSLAPRQYSVHGHHAGQPDVRCHGSWR
ncbi:MAG: choice-of-anchor D domain-containing protein [Saprospiraceae bacterium]